MCYSDNPHFQQSAYHLDQMKSSPIRAYSLAQISTPAEIVN
jgi:hypothetical protein